MPLTTNTPAPLAGKRVLVMGLGRFGGGVGVSRWLAAQGALVTVTDAAKPEELAESVKALEGLPITFKLGAHDVADFLATELLVINPAVDRAKSEVVQAALNARIPTTTEMNLFLERCQGITVGITGSVGKSTTTALIYEALQAGLNSPDAKIHTPPSPTQQSELRTQHSPPRVYVGGNIGRSLLLDLPGISPHDIVVLELSSFMLEETPAIRWSPHLAVVTNVFPNHLDRHGTMAAYSAAKQNILRFQRPTDMAILNGDHELVTRWSHLAHGRVLKYTTRGPASTRLDLAMPGEHNQSNASAARATVAALAAEQIPLDIPAALRAIAAYPGLPHRLQCVRTLDLGEAPVLRRIRFYNDSKATSPDASITAIRAFDPQTAIFIVGGYDKHISMDEFQTLLAERAAGVIGIGQTGQALLDGVTHAAQDTPGATLPPTCYAGTLEHAVAKAYEWAKADSRVRAVVLSPASASWDQFPNYEKRGEEFGRFASRDS